MEATAPTAQDPKDMPTPSAPEHDPRPQRHDAPPREDLVGRDVIAAAADGKKLSEGEKLDALDLFLSSEEVSQTEVIELNVGSRNSPRWIEWEVKPVDLETLRRIRKQATSTRRGEQGEIDEIAANLRIVVEGTVTPDLKVIAKQQGIIDPADALKLRFGRKPGLLGQIAGEIMSVSGYDDEDVREVDAGKS